MNYIVSKNRYGHWCCGFLLTPSWVGTAAHCIVQKTTKNPRTIVNYRTTLFFLAAGTANIREKDSLHQLRYPEYFVPHPDYQSYSLHEDVGLIKVRRPFSFNKNMGLVIFPKHDYRVESWKTCVVAGWGITEMGKRSDQLLFAEPNILPNELCLWSVGSNFYFNPKGSICTISKKNKKAACKGDSGSPLVCDVPGAEGGILAPDLIDSWKKEGYSPEYGLRKAVGIVSWSWNCTERGVPTVYTDIRDYRSWMREVVHSGSSSLYQTRLILLCIFVMHLF